MSTNQGQQGARPPQRQENESTSSQLWGMVQKGLLIYAASQLLTAFLGARNKANDAAQSGSQGEMADSTGIPIDPMTLPPPKTRKEHNLLTSKNETVVEEEEDDQSGLIVPYWHPNLTLALISDSPVLNLRQIAPVIYPHLSITGERDESKTNTFYMPMIFPNDFWHLREHEVEINATYPQDPNEKLFLPLSVTFQPMSYMKMQVYASMTHGFEEAAKNGQAAGELDEIKRMLVETNPWFLALTATVSILHMVFEMLAFKNDVAHWRKKDQMVGVSLRTVGASHTRS
ncbi:hypothetical protein FRC19_010677 [Serendipita sp. 401]|nr:hypothetical protein FRC19_010677 [Serendipita sp. 401]